MVILLGPDFHPLELLLLKLDIFNQLELFLLDLFCMFLEILHLLGHLLQLGVVGLDLLLLGLNFLLGR
jgi:hypothetical protein